jgi:hypothetical protein
MRKAVVRPSTRTSGQQPPKRHTVLSIAKNETYGGWKRAVAETLSFWLSFKLASKEYLVTVANVVAIFSFCVFLLYFIFISFLSCDMRGGYYCIGIEPLYL